MQHVAWIPALLFALVVSTSGQTPATQAAQKPDTQKAAKPDQPAADQPADFTAFNDASKTADPKKRIEAFQKLLEDYPDSMLAGTARGLIREQLTRTIRDSTKTLLAEIESGVEAMNGNQLTAYWSAASSLLRAGILLDEAEKLAEKGLAATSDEQKYLEQASAARDKPKPATPKGTVAGRARMSSAGGSETVTWMPSDSSEAPTPQPTDEEVRELYRVRRAQLRVTLAQIYLKRGKDTEAEKLFKQVYADAQLPELKSQRSAAEGARAAAARELTTFARKAGDDRALVQYLMDSVIQGARPDVHKELREAYKKTHGGSFDGLEATLDAMYAKAVPKIDVKAYDRPKTLKEQRMVLAELFTGSECGPCVGIDLAFEAALQRYRPEDLAFLVYHQHMPGPDPMTNAATQLRKDFYGVRGVPTYYVDGKTDGDGGGGADLADGFYTRRVKPGIELSMGVPPEASLTLAAAVNGSAIKVKAAVTKVTRKSDRLRLQIVLAEQRLRFQGGNGVRWQPMVVRSIASVPLKTPAAGKASKTTAKDAAANSPDAAPKTPAVEQGFAIPQGKGLKVDYTFDLGKIAAQNRAFIDDFLTRPFRGGPDKPAFSSRMDEIDPRQLVIVAFVQDEDPTQGGGQKMPADSTASVALRHVLQAAAVRIGAGKTTD